MSTASISLTAIGVGIDTARYGHHVTFLQEDGQQLAAAAYHFKEAVEGHQRLLDTLLRLQQQHPEAHFHIHIDAAGQYATNLERFLRGLPIPKTVSVGEPTRNKNYRKVIFPKRKADAAESFALARFAVVERPRETPATSEAFYALREVASRLESQIRHTGRCLNQLHNLLSRVFPELPVLASNLSAAWVLQLLKKYPTPEKIARAHQHSLVAIPYITAERAAEIRQAAQQTVGTLRGDVAEQLVVQAAEELRHSQAKEDKLEKLLEQSFRALPVSNHIHLLSIPGLGLRTVAVLVAKMVSIDRFETPEDLVGYFGIFPEEDSSGVDKNGKPYPLGTAHMSHKGNDLVRKHLWMAAMTASVYNPAVNSLYARLIAKNVNGNVALGHCMRKLLHLVFAIWKSGKPFDPAHYPWDSPRPERPSHVSSEETAVGRNQDKPERQAVTTATGKVPAATHVVQPSCSGEAVPATPVLIDFRALRAELSMERVLRHLKLFDELRGRRNQLSGPCPKCTPPGSRKRPFNVNLNKHAFSCKNSACRIEGNVIDLWAKLHNKTAYAAAVDLASTFGIPLPVIREEATR